jgi:hypothetical protein
MRTSVLTTLLLLVGVTALPLCAGTIPIMYGTGVDASGNDLAGGSADPHYTISPPGSAAIVESASSHYPAWVAGQWDSSNDSTSNACCGDYVFTTQLDLVGYSSYSGTLVSLQWSADDSASDILINGIDQPGTALGNGSWSSLYTFTIDGSNSALQWNAINTVTFTVDFTDVETNGLIVDVTSAAPSLDGSTPEPSTLFLLAGGLGCIALFARLKLA